MQLFMSLESESNLEDIVRYNIKKAESLRKSLKQLNEIAQKNINMEVEESATTNFNDDNYVLDTVEEVEEYRYYYDNILKALSNCKTSDEKEKAIFENLPVLDNKEYTNIVCRIKAELLLEIKQYQSFIELEDNNAIKSEYLQEQKNILELIKIIDSHKEKVLENDDIKEEKNHNTLIFFKTSSGKVYAENDLAAIPLEFYQDFKELFETIEDGTFKGVKQFSSNDQILKGISEVKGFKTRIVFERIDYDKYAIIDVLVKKSDCDNGYLDQVKCRVDKYKKRKNDIISCLNSDFIEENNLIYERLKQGLNEKNIVKTK